MKRFILIFLVLISTLVIFSIDNQYFNEEFKRSFFFFWEQANINEKSSGYGLIRDRYPGNPNVASIASTGYGLAAIPIGIEKGWISYEEGYTRVNKTLDTLLNLKNIRGFFYHFLDINTGKRIWNSEISTIDTSILLCGVLTAGEYFGGEIKEKAEKLYKNVNWKMFVDKSTNYFYMAFYPEKGFSGKWDFYAEQLMMYILAAGSPTYPINEDVYYSFKRHEGNYKSKKFIHSWFGSLFTYQYSHAWIDFRNKKDKLGVDWFENSVNASIANYNYCVDLSNKFKSFSKDRWGLSACDSPNGYNGLFGAPPSGYNNKQHKVDGTIATSAALGSIVFTPDLSLKALNAFYKISGLVGKYGLKNAFNLDKNWIANDYIGIDKGIILLMFANYENEFVWKLFNKNQYIKNGLKRLEIQ
ncbi:glucoamylase family protein [Marinitoga aeolica]|uniref:Glycoamylase-like domain-containing protein n=1 Tax=Marinitoga aeolica TaxID=2809031 RepID=A0ABY8PPR9_9BACT|nr:glucoamylase family protein [Marinitoga aeolica]WGS64620.1 hypothetical protein JRV97_09625 [Marinitoga aeolica]